MSYTVRVPVQKTATYSVCASDTVSETKTESYVVRVPKKATKQVCVKVRKCVEEQVPAGNGADCQGAGKGGRGKGGLLGHCKKGC